MTDFLSEFPFSQSENPNETYVFNGVSTNEADSNVEQMNPNINNGKTGAKRFQVKRACYHCKKNHAACNNERPCQRCTKHGIEDQCFDVERKKRVSKPRGHKADISKDQETPSPVVGVKRRGRPKKSESNIVDSGNDSSNQQQFQQSLDASNQQQFSELPNQFYPAPQQTQALGNRPQPILQNNFSQTQQTQNSTQIPKALPFPIAPIAAHGQFPINLGPQQSEEQLDLFSEPKKENTDTLLSSPQTDSPAYFPLNTQMPSYDPTSFYPNHQPQMVELQQQIVPAPLSAPSSSLIPSPPASSSPEHVQNNYALGFPQTNYESTSQWISSSGPFSPSDSSFPQLPFDQVLVSPFQTWAEEQTFGPQLTNAWGSTTWTFPKSEVGSLNDMFSVLQTVTSKNDNMDTKLAIVRQQLSDFAAEERKESLPSGNDCFNRSAKEDIMISVWKVRMVDQYPTLVQCNQKFVDVMGIPLEQLKDQFTCNRLIPQGHTSPCPGGVLGIEKEAWPKKSAIQTATGVKEVCMTLSTLRDAQNKITHVVSHIIPKEKCAPTDNTFYFPQFQESFFAK